ncbi:MAG: hypothetical protein R3C13_04250 [Hyphomonas sp.]|uniref:hypothetical protein n=1 Tax=Hyphomonas sp. TaxID=87 RepID=UPI003527ACD1
MSPQTFADDLAYIRDLAEAGQKAPLLAGRFLAWWGGLAALAYVGHYLISSGALGLPLYYVSWMWGVFFVLGFGGFKFMQLTFPPAKPGAGSAGNRVSALVWMGAGFMLFAFFAGVIAKSFLDGSASIGFLWSVPVVLGAYGLSQLTSGLIAQSRPLIVAGWVAIASVFAAVLLVGREEIWLLGAAVAFSTVFVPGMILMREEPSETV